MSDLCIVINTCKEYYSNINNLINQINTLDENKTFPRENILIISGQEDEDSIIYQDDIKIVKVTYTGLHLTSFIYVYENINNLKDKFSYFFLLPDTIEFGKDFFVIISVCYNLYIKKSNVLSFPVLSHNVRPTMDLGILHYKHLNNIRDYLNKIKLSHPYNKDDLKKLKLQLIYNENIVLGMPSYFTNKCTKFECTTPPLVCPLIRKKDDVEETKITENNRIINKVYLKPFDLYKFQRNFSIDNELVLDL